MFIKLFRIFSLLLLISSRLFGFSQGNELWTRLAIHKKIDSSFGLSIDLQHRRQNDAKPKSGGHFEYPFLHSARLWVDYSINKSWKALVSPVAYFQMYKFTETGEKTRKAEWRTMIGTLHDRSKKRFSASNRFLYELSLVDPGEFQYLRHRYRWLSAFSYNLLSRKGKPVLQTIIGNELFFRTISGTTGFDQDRIQAALRFKKAHWSSTLGWQWNLLSAGTENHFKNQILLGLQLEY